jgi:hypothetical protein
VALDATKLFAWNLLGICAESFGMFGTALPKKNNYMMVV